MEFPSSFAEPNSNKKFEAENWKKHGDALKNQKGNNLAKAEKIIQAFKNFDENNDTEHVTERTKSYKTDFFKHV